MRRKLHRTVTILHGDCMDFLPTLGGFDACITDPPYELGFMGKRWDSTGIAFQPETWTAVYRVLKPGAYLVAFGGTRTFHRMTCAIEDAGFEIRDMLCWLYGSGFPKSLDVSKAIDKAAGVEREVIGRHAMPAANKAGGNSLNMSVIGMPDEAFITAPATPEAQQWAGWGTALKPAYEPIILARKPLAENTVAANVLKHGTGALNIDATRVPTSLDVVRSSRDGSTSGTFCEHAACPMFRNEHNGTEASSGARSVSHADPLANAPFGGLHSSLSTGLPVDYHLSGRSDDERARRSSVADQAHAPQRGGARMSPAHCEVCGRSREDLSNSFPRHITQDVKTQSRWPANVVHDGSPEVEAAFAEFGAKNNGHFPAKQSAHKAQSHGGWTGDGIAPERHMDAGNASRFFYTAKASAEDRVKSKHPTIKPRALMYWLAKLVTPPGGIVLDPFAGSGTTGEAAWLAGFEAVLIEREAEYVADIKRRLEQHTGIVDRPKIVIETRDGT